MAWTDERLDDLAQRMDAGFERVDRDIRELRMDMRDGFASVRAELREESANLRGEIREESTNLRREMHEGFASVRGEMREEFAAMRAMIWRFGGAMIVTFAGALAAVSLQAA